MKVEIELDEAVFDLLQKVVAKEGMTVEMFIQSWIMVAVSMVATHPNWGNLSLAEKEAIINDSVQRIRQKSQRDSG